MSVPAGASLIQQGEQPDAIYVVITGQFAAFLPAASGQAVLLDRFSAGDVISDTDFITGEASGLTVRALRNSELLRIAGTDLQEAAARCPDILLTVCSGVGEKAAARSVSIRNAAQIPNILSGASR